MGEGHDHKKVREASEGEGINMDGSPLTYLDLAKSQIRPGEKQCQAFKSGLYDLDKTSMLVSSLKKDGVQVIPAKEIRLNPEKMIWGGFDSDKDSYSGVMGTRPSLRPGEGSGIMRPLPEYAKLLPEIFEDSKTNAFVRSHNQILDLDWHKALREAGIKPDEAITLINVDAHADLHRYEDGTVLPEGNESIGNWVNTMLSKYPNIREFIWALPRDMKSDPALRAAFLESDVPDDVSLIASNPDRRIYINNKTGAHYWDELPEGAAASDYRSVRFRKLAVQDLPDMSKKKVLLTTDLDTFGLSDKDKDAKPYLSTRGGVALQEYVELLKERNLKPFAHVSTISREFLEDNMAQELERFGLLSLSAANAGNAKDLASYFRNRTEVRSASEGKREPGESHNGILTERSENKVLSLLQKLYEIDRLSLSPDSALNLQESNENTELQIALKETAKLFNVTETASKAILEKLAKKSRFGPFDNLKILRHEWIAEMLQHVCQNELPRPNLQR